MIVDVGFKEFPCAEEAGSAGVSEAVDREPNEGVIECEVGVVTGCLCVLVVELILPVRVHPSDVCNSNVDTGFTRQKKQHLCHMSSSKFNLSA